MHFNAFSITHDNWNLSGCYSQTVLLSYDQWSVSPALDNFSLSSTLFMTLTFPEKLLFCKLNEMF